MIRGWDVTALHRPSSDLKLLKRFRPKLAVGELSDANSLLAAIPQGTDTVFHVAGNTNMWRGGNAQQTRDNVDGTRHVVEAALAKRVRRLVVTSSISAYGPVDGEITEETPSLAANSPASIIKRPSGRRRSWRAPPSPKGLEVVIMQPGAIMGAYDIGTWSRLFVMVRDDKLPGVPPSLLTFTHVREVVAAHIAAADKGASGGSYLLGGENKTMMELVREISALVGKPAPTKETSMALLRVVAVVGRSGEPIHRQGAAHYPGNGQPDEPESQHILCQGTTRARLSHRPVKGNGEGLLRLDGGGRAALGLAATRNTRTAPKAWRPTGCHPRGRHSCRRNDGRP